MAVTVKGFQGSVSDADMATQFPTVPGVVTSSADSAVSAVGGARQVSVAPGSPNAHFVKRISDAAETLTLAPPSSGGKWYVIAVNRQWSPTNTAVLEAVDVGIATDGTVPTAAPVPTALPAGLRNNPGTAGSTSAFGHHQPLAWVHVRAADTTLTLFDLRHVVSSSGIVAAASFAALVMGGLYRPPMNTTQIPCLDGITYRWNGTKWCPWESPWYGITLTLLNWNLGNGATTRFEARWEDGFFRVRIWIALGSSASNTDGLIVTNLPEPVRYIANAANSTVLAGNSRAFDPTNGGYNFPLDIEVTGENLARVRPVCHVATGGFVYTTPIGAGTPFLNGALPQSAQVWLDFRYESNTYPRS